MPPHGKQSSMRFSSGGRNSTVEPFSRLISIPTTSRMSMGVRAMTAFGVLSPREAYNFRKGLDVIAHCCRLDDAAFETETHHGHINEFWLGPFQSLC